MIAAGDQNTPAVMESSSLSSSQYQPIFLSCGLIMAFGTALLFYVKDSKTQREDIGAPVTNGRSR